MEITLDKELKQAKRKTAKPMLWIAIVSMIMMFAGLTSAYIVSSARQDWVSFQMPNAFYVSTLLILLSSTTFFMAKKFIRKDNRQITSILLLTTLALGIAFVVFQFIGYNQLINSGLYLTGPESRISSSLFYVISFAHLLHIIAGLVVVSVVIFNHFRFKYNSSEVLGIELGSIFWHFLDILWIALFLFFYLKG
ncbi:cytochrome c oxidase subunit 3 [Aureivirga marina]|uniref:cytochrome c oxidase subunit 3 n=1 Tax=Aureivirga marina TaxID=1182451 RepID=UPI0018C97C52|nr:cytochrome c oxidase subunit 3 [Aureivirga marina]